MQRAVEEQKLAEAQKAEDEERRQRSSATNVSTSSQQGGSRFTPEAANFETECYKILAEHKVG